MLEVADAELAAEELAEELADAESPGPELIDPELAQDELAGDELAGVELAGGGLAGGKPAGDRRPEDRWPEDVLGGAAQAGGDTVAALYRRGGKVHSMPGGLQRSAEIPRLLPRPPPSRPGTDPKSGKDP